MGAQVLAPGPGGALGWTPVFLVQHRVKPELHDYLRIRLEGGAQVCSLWAATCAAAHAHCYEGVLGVGSGWLSN